MPRCANCARAAPHAGHHVQFAHAARRARHHRGAGQRRFRLRRQAGQPGRSARSHALPGSRAASQDHALTALRAAAIRTCAPCAHCGSRRTLSCRPSATHRLDSFRAGHRRLHRRPRCARPPAPRIPGNVPLPVLIVQHMPELFTRLLAERLNGRCRLRVREAAEGDPVQPGTIYIARGNWHHGNRAPLCARAAANASPEPGPARESLPAFGRRPLSLRRSRLRLRRAGRGPHRHGLRWLGRLPHHPRTRWHRARPGSGHQHRLGHARRGRPGRPGARVLPLQAIAPEILRLTAAIAHGDAKATSADRR